MPGRVSRKSSPARSAAVNSGFTAMPSGVCHARSASFAPASFSAFSCHSFGERPAELDVDARSTSAKLGIFVTLFMATSASCCQALMGFLQHRAHVAAGEDEFVGAGVLQCGFQLAGASGEVNRRRAGVLQGFRETGGVLGVLLVGAADDGEACAGFAEFAGNVGGFLGARAADGLDAAHLEEVLRER